MGIFQFIHTQHGIHYARRIGRELNVIGHHYFLSNIFNCSNIFDKRKEDFYAIHPRVAYPYPQYSNFMTFLLQNAGNVIIINSPTCLALTSNKYKCNKVLGNTGISIPETILARGDSNDLYKTLDDKEYVMKPIISNGGGKNIFRFSGKNDYEGFLNAYLTLGEKNAFIQEYIRVQKLYRIILVNNEAYRYTFFDTPEFHHGDWKLSVCMNRNMGCTATENISKLIVDLARRAQRVVTGYINFIDVFESRDGKYYLSEINTSCNLRLHEVISDSNIAEFIAKGLVKYVNW